MIKKFNQLFENNNYSKKEIEDLYTTFHDKYCIAGLLYLMKTTDIDPNFNVGDGSSLAYIDEYFKGDYDTLIDLVKVLIKKGADVNTLDIDGKPPISIAKSYDIIRLLLDADCDLNIVIDNGDGEDVLEYDETLRKFVEKEYPKNYEKYLRKKQAKKFKI